VMRATPTHAFLPTVTVVCPALTHLPPFFPTGTATSGQPSQRQSGLGLGGLTVIRRFLNGQFPPVKSSIYRPHLGWAVQQNRRAPAGRPGPVVNNRARRLLGLAAQESRDLELIVGVVVMHRRRPAMLVEALRRSPLGIFRHRLDARRRPRPLRQ